MQNCKQFLETDKPDLICVSVAASSINYIFKVKRNLSMSDEINKYKEKAILKFIY